MREGGLPSTRRDGVGGGAVLLKPETNDLRANAISAEFFWLSQKETGCINDVLKMLDMLE